MVRISFDLATNNGQRYEFHWSINTINPAVINTGTEMGTMIFKKIGIYRKCDKKAKTVYWEKKIKKRIKSWF